MATPAQSPVDSYRHGLRYGSDAGDGQQLIRSTFTSAAEVIELKSLKRVSTPRLPAFSGIDIVD
jgi:hypothetical protein